MFLGLKTNKRLGVVSLLFLAACSSPDESAVEHLEKGKELFEKGEYDKAVLELKTSTQAGDQKADTYYYMALLDEKANNFKSMRQNLIKTLELAPDNIDARQKLGKVHLLFGDFDKSMEQVDLILTARPNDTQAQLLKASVLVRQNKHDLANQLTDSVLAAEPDNIDALSLKAALHLERNDSEGALAAADKVLVKDPKNLPIHLFKIKVNAKDNKVDAVISEYQELIKLYPDSNNFKLSLASIYSMVGKNSEAEALLRELVKNSGDKADARIVLLEYLNAKDKERVPSEFQAMLEAVKSQTKSMLDLSKWMLASGYIDAATDGLRKVVAAEGNSNLGLTAQTVLAEIALNKKDFATTNEAVEKILAANSDFIDANLLKAKLLLAQNNTDSAIELLNKTVWSKNDSDNAYLLLGQAYLQKRDQKQADKNFKQALEINPANLGAFLPIYSSYINANQKETARQYLNKALQANPNQVLLLTNKAELDISEGKWEEAQDAVQKLALFAKNKAVPTYFQANIMQAKGEYDKAIKVYEDLLRQYPDHLESMVNLARCYDALHKRDQAIHYLESHHEKFNNQFAIVGVLADLYVANKDFSKAKELLSKQIDAEPARAVPLYLVLAKVEAMLKKNIEGARDVYLRGLNANPDNPQLAMALAQTYEQTGDKDKAIQTYEKILVKYPDANLATNNLAALLVESEDIEQVKKGLTLAEKFKDAENPYLLDTYAWGLVKTGKTDEGLKILESLILKEPKLPELRYHLGVAHLNNGNKTTALIELKQAIALAGKQNRAFSGIEQAKKIINDTAAPTAK